jgi:arylsulfatase A-like enzyme
MVESGVRFVEVTADGWDHHSQLTERLPASCESVDKPIAGLLADLKQRDLLKDTLVIFAGEFGRTPHGSGNGRGHNNKGYTTWMAGGGVKPGFSYGSTDEIGREAVEGKMHTHDWHATILHLLGLDHKKLTFNYAGRDFRLTNVAGEVAEGILA